MEEWKVKASRQHAKHSVDMGDGVMERTWSAYRVVRGTFSDLPGLR